MNSRTPQLAPPEPRPKQPAPPLAAGPAPSGAELRLLLPNLAREPPRGEAPAAQSCGLRMAWRRLSHPHRSPGCSRRCCREAEPPLLQSREPGNTRDMRPRRSGTTPACCRPATSPRGDAQGKARGRIRGGRQRRARQLRETRWRCGGGQELVPSTSCTSNFPRRS